jgi:hypothetical protein
MCSAMRFNVFESRQVLPVVHVDIKFVEAQVRSGNNKEKREKYLQKIYMCPWVNPTSEQRLKY